MEHRDNWEDTPFIPPRDIILIRRISEGAFGMVYKAIYMYQTVAVKVFREASPTESLTSTASSTSSSDVPLIRQMEHEVRVLRNLRHKNVVGFLGAVEDPPAIVMEYCRSGSLWDVLRRAESSEKIRKKLSWTRRVNLLLGAAQGMAFVHAGIGTKPEILHRDLKSPNVLLDKDWVVKIADFGLSRFVDPHLNTQWDVIANNPTWMPPEVVDVSAKPHEFNQSTDVYPLGIIMWELMTLEKPWSIQDDMARRVAQIIACLVLKRDRPPIPEDLSTVPGVKDRTEALRAYVALMSQCWAHEPSSRPTYKEVVVKLQHIKDLFMRRPPPSLDRLKTNDMLVEMLSLWKHPQGALRDQIPLSDSYMEKVLGGGSLESGSFLHEDPSLQTIDVSEVTGVFEGEPEGNESNDYRASETILNAPWVDFKPGKPGMVPPSSSTLTSPFASIPLPPPMSTPSGVHPSDLGYQGALPDSPAPYRSPFQIPNTQQYAWPPSGDTFTIFRSGARTSGSDSEAETRAAPCASANDKLGWEAMDEG